MMDDCDLGVGCNESGVCYAAAHNRPEMCGVSEEICRYCKGAGIIYGHEEAESEECSTCSGLGWMPLPEASAKAMEARQGQDAKRLNATHDSAVAKPFAQMKGDL